MPAWGMQSYKAWIEDSACRGANVLLSGGTDMLGDGDALRDSRGAGFVCVGGMLICYAAACVCDEVAPECAR